MEFPHPHQGFCNTIHPPVILILVIWTKLGRVQAEPRGLAMKAQFALLDFVIRLRLFCVFNLGYM